MSIEVIGGFSIGFKNLVETLLENEKEAKKETLLINEIDLKDDDFYEIAKAKIKLSFYHNDILLSSVVKVIENSTGLDATRHHESNLKYAVELCLMEEDISKNLDKINIIQDTIPSLKSKNKHEKESPTLVQNDKDTEQVIQSPYI